MAKEIMHGLDQIAPQGPHPTILVVDDNKGVLEFLLLLLSKHGLSVIGASSGNECLDIVKRRPVDLIVLDVMMPVLDGLQVCQELKKITPSIPIILLTARDDMTTRAAAMDLGVSEFIVKPVHNRDLLNRVRMQLRNLEWDKTADEASSKIEKSALKADSKNHRNLLNDLNLPAHPLACPLWPPLVADRKSPSVHWQIDSVDKVGLIRRKKNRRLRDVHRCSSAPSEVFDDTIFRNCFLADRRADAVGRDRIDPDTLGRQLHRHRASQIQNSSFGGRIGGRLFTTPMAGGGCNVNDPAPPLLIDHDACRGPATIPDASKTHVHRPVPLFLSNIKDRLVIRPGCVVDQNIDAPVLFYHPLHHCLYRTCRGHVADNGNCISRLNGVDLPCHATTSARIEIDYRNFGSFLGKKLADIFPDIAPGASDNRNLILEPHIFHPNGSRLDHDPCQGRDAPNTPTAR